MSLQINKLLTYKKCMDSTFLIYDVGTFHQKSPNFFLFINYAKRKLCKCFNTIGTFLLIPERTLFIF